SCKMMSSAVYRGLAAITAVAALLLTRDALAQDRENKKYCNESGSVIVFLVDITTPYDVTDKTAIVRMTDEILDSMKGGERLTIRTISDSHTHSEKLIERCMPFCPEASSFGKLFSCSDGLIRTDAEKVRRETIQSLRERLLRFEELRFS